VLRDSGHPQAPEQNERVHALGTDEKSGDAWPVQTERINLTPLFPVLNKFDLHTYIGGRASSLDELKARYARFESGSGKDCEVLVNWIVRIRSGGVAIGTVEATIVDEDERIAEVSRIIGIP
jgi:hypothetical protein